MIRTLALSSLAAMLTLAAPVLATSARADGWVECAR